MEKAQKKIEEEYTRRLDYYASELSDREEIILRLKNKIDKMNNLSNEKKRGLKIETEKWGVEKNYSGDTVTVYRNGDKLSIHSKKYGEVINDYSKLKEDIISLTSKNFILNAKLKDNIMHVFDIEQFDKDTTTLPFYERKKILNSLKYTDNIKEVYSIIVDNEEDLKKTISAFNRIPNNKGVVVKKFNSKHPKKGEDSWYLFKDDTFDSTFKKLQNKSKK